MREFKGDWRDLFFGFRISLDLRKIFLAFVGAIFTAAGLVVILGLGAWIDQPVDFTTLVKDVQVADAFKMVKFWTIKTFLVPLTSLWHDPVKIFGFLTPRVSEKWTRCGWPGMILPEIILLAAGMWLVFIWSNFGGAITRIAAVEIAKDERITTNEALGYAKKKYSSYFWSPVSVLFAFLFFYFVNSLGGLLAWIPYAGPVLVALLSILAFLGGFIALLIAIGGFFGWPLMSPAVSAEGTDAFDAVSRAFSYVYSRPWQYAFYWLVSAVYGLASAGFVWLFAWAMIYITVSSTQVGAGRSIDPAVRAIFAFGEDSSIKDLDVFSGIVAVTLGTIVVLLLGLAGSYAISFVYTARTLMYFILRKRVDNTEMNEVYMEEDEEDLFDEGGGGKGAEAGGEAREGGAADAKEPKECGDTPPAGEVKKPDDKPAGADKPAGPAASEPPKP